MRRVFISYQHRDHRKAQGFNLLQWNKNVDFEVSTRHLLKKVNSEDRSYISGKIREQLKGTSVTVVLIGRETHQSKWVADEVAWSHDKDRRNGVLGILLEPNAKVPECLTECGAEVIEWNVDLFEDAIERAALAAGRGEAIASSVSTSGESCGR